MIFQRWWPDDKIRSFIFDFLEKEDLSKTDYLLKWWDEAKARNAHIILKEYSQFSILNIQSGNIDSFLMVLMKALKEDESFLRELEEIIKPSDSSTPLFTVIRGSLELD